MNNECSLEKYILPNSQKIKSLYHLDYFFEKNSINEKKAIREFKKIYFNEKLLEENDKTRNINSFIIQELINSYYSIIESLFINFTKKIKNIIKVCSLSKKYSNSLTKKVKNTNSCHLLLLSNFRKSKKVLTALKIFNPKNNLKIYNTLSSFRSIRNNVHIFYDKKLNKSIIPLFNKKTYRKYRNFFYFLIDDLYENLKMFANENSIKLSLISNYKYQINENIKNKSIKGKIYLSLDTKYLSLYNTVNLLNICI